MVEDDALLQRGLELHKKGQYQAAADAYRELVGRNPKRADVLYLLGCLTHQTGNSSGALKLLRDAVDAEPNTADYRNALGVVLCKLQQYEEGEAHLRQATDLGDRPEFHTSLAKFLKQQNRLTEAVAQFKQALEKSPDDIDLHLSLGETYAAAGKTAEAIAAFECAVQVNPLHTKSLAALRTSFRSASRDVEARQCLASALERLPPDADRLCDFAGRLQDAKDFEGAVQVYTEALRVNPESASAWYARGCAEQARNEFVLALSCFKEARRLRPDWLENRHNLARCLYEMGQVDAAYEQFKICAAGMGEAAKTARAMVALIVPGVNVDNAAVLGARRAWVKQDLPHTNTERRRVRVHSPDSRLRIGYVSSFFHRDNWMKPVWGLINQHDRSAFEVSLFSDAPRSAIQHGYRADERDRFVEITKLSNEAVAQTIHDSGIGILVDLNGYSNMKRLPMFLHRPAPLVAGWFNSYATTGMKEFDYLVGDSHVIPRDEERFYAETIARVTGSYLTFAVDYPVPPVADLPWIGNSAITFGSLSSQYKITPVVIEAWSRILNGVPGSTLLIKNKRLSSPAACEFVHTLFARHGIATERVRLEGPGDHFEFLKAYDRIDVALDTFPYNGGTTTTEAIWQGVPVLTFSGDRWASRTSASILHAGGLGEFVANDLEGFVHLAIGIGNAGDSKDRLRSRRRAMRDQLQCSDVCNTKKFAREMESLYQTWWETKMRNR